MRRAAIDALMAKPPGPWQTEDALLSCCLSAAEGDADSRVRRSAVKAAGLFAPDPSNEDMAGLGNVVGLKHKKDDYRMRTQTLALEVRRGLSLTTAFVTYEGQLRDARA